MTFLLTSLFWLIIVIWQREQSYQEGIGMGKLIMKLQYSAALSKLPWKKPAGPREEVAGYLKALEDLTDLIIAEKDDGT